MHRIASMLRRAVWLTCLCALLLASRADASESTLVADFDGDGQGDRVTRNWQEPSVLRVWLSATRTTDVIRSREPLRHVVAADLDGDRRAELIVSNRSRGLRIWTKKHKGFRAYHPKQAPSPIGLSRPTGHAFDDGPPTPMLEMSASRPVPPSLALSVRPPAPTFGATRHAPRFARAPISPQYFAPFAPRPPPAPAV